MNKKLSLQEQLLQAGLVSNAKAKAIKTEKNKQIKQQRHQNAHIVDDAKMLAQKAIADKVERDRVLNQQQQLQSQQKEISAQIKQLIAEHQMMLDPQADIPYHFTDASKVKTIYVTEMQRDQLAKGHIAIIKEDQRYSLIHAEIAQKIKERDSTCIVLWNEQTTYTPSPDDPYASYQIPDDLMW
jgi:uncharacterized protein YaiL (DUF2058 family)